MAGSSWRIAISIHVLREEDDAGKDGLIYVMDISIHVLREEDDSNCRPVSRS